MNEKDFELLVESIQKVEKSCERKKSLPVLLYSHHLI